MSLAADLARGVLVGNTRCLVGLVWAECLSARVCMKMVCMKVACKKVVCMTVVCMKVVCMLASGFDLLSSRCSMLLSHGSVTTDGELQSVRMYVQSIQHTQRY